MGKRRGKAAKKARQSQLLQGEGQELVEAPHSFVIHRGKVGKYVTELVKDMRRVMAPYTAETLKVKKKNKFKDFVSVAGPLHVSHMLMFTKTEKSVNFRVCRLPRGPTLTFQVKTYCLARDVLSVVNRHNMEPKQFIHHPLLVMNNFKSDDVQVKLMANMFQNLFPSINVDKVKLSDIRRCVLLNYDAETMQIEFRHYNIRVAPVGIGRAVKKIVQSKVPNLSTLADISEYVMNAGNMSESEAELDVPDNKVVLPQNVCGRGNMKSSQSAIRLTEIGPRMTMKLVKIEEGLCNGAVLYHSLLKKTPEELETIKKDREQKRQLKARRRAQQEERVKLKAEQKLEQQARSRAGAAAAAAAAGRATAAADLESDGGAEEVASDNEFSGKEEEEDDDAAFYRQEVGAEPDTASSNDNGASTDDKASRETLTLPGELSDSTVMPSTSSGDAGSWDAHTRDIASKLMSKMGYVSGQGLGRDKQGRVEPVPILRLPKGKSLDKIMQLRQRMGDVDAFNVLKPLQKRRFAGEQGSAETGKRPCHGVFDFLNHTFAGVKKDAKNR